MKKSLNLTKFLCLMFAVTFSINSVVFGSQTEKNNGKSKIILENKEIKDLNVLFQRAKKGITDAPSITVQKGTIKNSKTGIDVPTESFSTTQLLSDNGETKTYCQTSFLVAKDLPNEDINNNINSTDLIDSKTSAVSTIQALSSGGGYYQFDDDASYGVKAYCTSYYSNGTTTGGYPTISFTSSTGGWTVSDSTIKLSARVVTLGEAGTNSYNQMVSHYSDRYPTTNTFSYPVGYEALKSDLAGSIGTKTSVTLTRGSSIWSLNLNDIYVYK
jgi:hypothetical protein